MQLSLDWNRARNNGICIMSLATRGRVGAPINPRSRDGMIIPEEEPRASLVPAESLLEYGRHSRRAFVALSEIGL